MKKKMFALTIALALLIVTAIPAFAAGPNFGEAVYANGVAWGTKGTTSLPAPNEHNMQSFDKLFAFTNGVVGQLSVAEAAPGNPAYNGGRWIAKEVTWNEGYTPVLVTSYAQLHELEMNNAVTISDPAEEDLGPLGRYFQCPLLPVK